MMYWTVFELRDPPNCFVTGAENYTGTLKLRKTLEARWWFYSGDNRPDYVFG